MIHKHTGNIWRKYSFIYAPNILEKNQIDVLSTIDERAEAFNVSAYKLSQNINQN